MTKDGWRKKGSPATLLNRPLNRTSFWGLLALPRVSGRVAREDLEC
jgi:hypothetical protein